MTPVARNRLLLVVALVAGGGALAFIAMGNLGENLVYYWTPSEMAAQGPKAYGPTVRLGGVVRPGSLKWEPEKTRLTFQVADNRTATSSVIDVESHSTPPQMFREGIGVVVEGTYSASKIFAANRLMVNHSNEYRPPDGGQDHMEWSKSLADGDGAKKP